MRIGLSVAVAAFASSKPWLIVNEDNDQ